MNKGTLVMKKFRLLLLDANVVIELFKLGIWEKLIDVCDIHLSKIIVEQEAHFYLDDDKERQNFDLKPYVESGQVTAFEVPISQITSFCSHFDPTYFERLDPGEAESLAYLVNSKETCLISSADSIVFRVLGNLGLGEQGISLQEILQKIGLEQKVKYQFSSDFRKKETARGFKDGMYGRGTSG